MCRDIYQGRIAFARPLRVIQDDGDWLVGCIGPGARCQMQASYSLGQRNSYLTDLSRGEWALRDYRWHSYYFLWLVPRGRWYAFYLFFAADTRSFSRWYVNFQEPMRRHSLGFDTFDLSLDLVMNRDRAWHWKDEDEFELARKLGIIPPASAHAVRAARTDVLEQIAERVPPLDGSWTHWVPDPASCELALPPGWQQVRPTG